MQKSVLIQNVDVAAKAKQYAHMAPGTLLVYSTFYTIQGEGPYAGRPAFFIRLAGCNFGAKDKLCSGCDTKFFLKDGKVTDYLSLVDKAISVVGQYGLIVVTGGEPCLQSNLVDFCRVARCANLVVQIETNGTQTAVMDACAVEGANVVCSPKASAKGYFKNKPPWATKTVSSLKFVVTSDESDAHHTIPDWAFVWAGQYGKKLYVSPLTVYRRAVQEGEIVSAWDTTLVDHPATAKNYAYAAKLALSNKNLIVSTQQHTFLALE